MSTDGPGYVNRHANGIDWRALREEQVMAERDSSDDREQLAIQIRYDCFQFFQEPETYSAHRVATEVVDSLLRHEHTRQLLRSLLGAEVQE